MALDIFLKKKPYTPYSIYLRGTIGRAQDSEELGARRLVAIHRCLCCVMADGFALLGVRGILALQITGKLENSRPWEWFWSPPFIFGFFCPHCLEQFRGEFCEECKNMFSCTNMQQLPMLPRRSSGRELVLRLWNSRFCDTSDILSLHMILQAGRQIP